MGERAGARDRSAWLEARLDAVPATVHFLVDGATSSGGDARALARRARHACEAALRQEGDHGGAFRLLEADGLATLASLSALLEVDADRALAGVLDDLTR